MTITKQERANCAVNLLARLASHFNAPDDAAIARALAVEPPVISTIRSGRSPVTAGILLRIHEETGIGIRELKSYLPDGKVTD